MTGAPVGVPCACFAFFAFAACFSAPLPKKSLAQPEDCRPHTVGAGPEDFALDPRPGAQRLLVSVEERRPDREPGGTIMAVDTRSGAIAELERVGDDFIQPYRPHGVDALTDDDGRHLLYVILHGPGESPFQWNRIAVYEIQENRLVYRYGVEHGLIETPNDLAALPDGGLYVTNDVLDSFFSLLLGLENRTVIYCDAEGDCRVAAFGLAFPNGVARGPDGKRMYVAESRGHRVLSFEIDEEGTLREPRTVLEIRGPDNLFIADGQLYVAAHLDDFAFLGHKDDPREPSPSLVVRLDLRTGESTALYASPGAARPQDAGDADSGENEEEAWPDGSDGHISAASGAVPLGGSLWIAQVFNDYLLECRLPREK